MGTAISVCQLNTVKAADMSRSDPVHTSGQMLSLTAVHV